jgi:hypothetical protein
MDSEFLIQQLRQFIFTLASQGPLVFLGTLGILVFGLGPVGRALAARIRGSEFRPGLPQDPSVTGLQATVSELQERLDFSERMMAELRAHDDVQRLQPPKIKTPPETTPV